MRVVLTPDTNIARLNGFSCCIGKVIGNPGLHPLVPKEANITFLERKKEEEEEKLIQPGGVFTTRFTARQVQDGWLDTLASRRGVRSPRPAEVAERSHGFPSKVVGGEPVVVHHSEGQTGKPMSVLLRTDVAARDTGGRRSPAKA